MLRWFKKIKQVNKKDQRIKGQEKDEDETTDFVFSYSAINEQANFKTTQAWVSNWEKYDGNFVTKGDSICTVEIRGNNQFNESAFLSTTGSASCSGFLERLKELGDEQHNLINDGEILFIIHPKISKSKTEQLKNKRLKNIAQITLDEFQGTKELRWLSVAGRVKRYSYDSSICDSFVFYANDNLSEKLIFTVNNLSQKDYIIFRFPARSYKLSIGSRISFLFENGEIICFEITTKPHKQSEHIDWGNIFETRVQLTVGELEILKEQTIIKWQIEIPKTEKKIIGVIESKDDQFAVSKLIAEYLDLVRKEIDNYEPLIDKQKKERLVTKSSKAEACFLYLMLDTTNNYHKIGISNKPVYREKTLQSEKPTIEMVCAKRFPNRKIAASFEQALHQAYSEKRIRGEWFDLSNKEIKEIEESLL